MDGGGGGGGALDSIQNFIDQGRDVIETSVTMGMNQTEDAKAFKKSADTFLENASGRTAKEAAKKESFNAQRSQREREQAMAAAEAKDEAQSKFATARNKQKSAAKRGRSSTILTSPLGEPGGSESSGGKTLLGS